MCFSNGKSSIFNVLPVLFCYHALYRSLSHPHKRASEIGDLFVTHAMWMSFVIVLNKDDVKVRTWIQSLL